MTIAVTLATKSSTVPSNTPAVAPGAPATQSAKASAQPEAAPAAVAAAEVHVPAGTTLAIRISQHISVKTSRPGDHFEGEVAEPVHGDDGPGHRVCLWAVSVLRRTEEQIAVPLLPR